MNILQERDLTRLAYVAGAICNMPGMWERFLLPLTGRSRFFSFETSSELEDVVNGMWDAFSTSKTVREAANKLYAQQGARKETALILYMEMDLNHTKKELFL